MVPAMINSDIYYCMNEIGAEILMVISSFLIAISTLYLYANEIMTEASTTSEQGANLILSSAYALFLPLMSYLFSQAKQYNSEGRAQVLLIWMVLIENIRINADPIFTWTLRKSVEQLVRLIWVGFLVCSYARLHGIRVSLLVLCICFGVCEVMKVIMFNRAKDSYLIGKNPLLIHNYVERKIFQHDLHTTPMHTCNYIVMGEENHEIIVCSNGYVLGEKKSSSDILTIGRVFQLNSSEDEKFTSAHPYWRDICLSHALAKMLRRRFAKLPIDEAGCRKSLDFVLEGMIGNIGSNRDIQTDGNDGERNPTERVFSIIQVELKYVSEFLHTTVPIFYYFDSSMFVRMMAFFVTFGNGIYVICTISKKSSSWLSLVVEKAYNHCFSHGSRYGSMVVKIFTHLDLAITILLFVACFYIQASGMFMVDSPRWSTLKLVEEYIKDPTGWNRSHNSRTRIASTWDSHRSRVQNNIEKLKQQIKKAMGTRVHYSSIIGLETETIFFCIKVDLSTLPRLPKWIRRIIPRSTPTVIRSTDAEEAILKSLKKSDGRLTNGETSLRNYGMNHLNWACQPNASITETILIWHIATTLFHNHETSHSNPQLSQEENSTLLSSLISSLSQLLFSLRREMERLVTIITSRFSFGTTADPISETSEPDNPFKKQEADPISETSEPDNPFKKQEVALELSNYCHYLVKYFPDLLPDELDFTEKIYERVRKEILDISLFFDQKPTTKYRCSYTLQAMWVESSVVGKGARLAKDLANCAADKAQVWTMLADFWAEMMLFIAPSDNIDGHQKILDRKELITQLWALLTHAGISTRPKPTRHQDHQSDSNAVPGEFNV